MVTATQAKALVPAELKGLMPSHALSFDQLYQFAQVCHASGIFEDVTDVAQAFVKICRGAELGIPPTTAMQGFDLIKKRLFIKPWLIAAKINACGYGAYVVEEQTPERCAIAFRRKYPERGWVTLPLVTYTIAEAKGHGLVQRSPHWQTSPGNMLYQRCMGRGGAMYFPELLAGIAPPPEDVEPDPEQLRRNVTALFGEPVDPTAPSSRVPLAPSPEDFFDERAVSTADIRQEGGDDRPREPAEPLRRVTRPAPGAAGEAAVASIAQIEARILASGGDVEQWYRWAENHFLKKPRVAFSVEDYQRFLDAVTARAQRSTPQTAQEAPGATQTPADVAQDVAPSDASTEAGEAPGGAQGDYLAGKEQDLFKTQEEEYGSDS